MLLFTYQFNVMKLIILLIFNIFYVESSFLELVSEQLYHKATKLLENDLKIYQFSSGNINEKFLPEIGNGHIATQIKNKCIFVNGLYNGFTVKSHRACVPTTLNWKIESKDKLLGTVFVLDSLIGLTKEILVFQNYNLSITTYALRNVRQLLVRNISLEIANPKTTALFSISGNKFNFSSPDIDFELGKSSIIIAKGLTRFPENNYTTKLPVYILTEMIPDAIQLNGSQQWMTFITSIDLDYKKALISFDYAIKNQPNLLHQHCEAWIETWKEGIVKITDADKMLKQSVHAAQYYIHSSLPFKEWSKTEPSWLFYGLSPGGLAHGNNEDDYMGHIFWDMDTWIYPSILPFQRNSALEMVKYRLTMLASAIEHSRNTGYSGARYPWESARTGFETTPSNACAKSEIHVSADISLAVQQLLWIESSSNIKLYKRFGKSIIEEIARFWASRLNYNWNETKFDINDVMPPDEYVKLCNNSAFTNMAARLALEAPVKLAQRYKSEITDEMMFWFYLGTQLSYSVDKSSKIILEHDKYKIGSIIKQADVMLLDYPLQLDIPQDYLLNSQKYYDQFTDINGPAMTWAIYSINWFKFRNVSKAENLFIKNYGYINLPFYVWSESINGTGAINFHTGMGGYLQNIINGFMGMRLNLVENGRMSFNPSVSKLIHGITLQNIKFQDSNFDINFNNFNISLTLLNEKSIQVFATLDSRTYIMTSNNRNLVIKNQEIVLTSLI